MNVSPIDFRDHLKSKNLAEKTIREYTYYLNKFVAQHVAFDQESVSAFLSDPSNMNCVAKAFLLILKKYMTMHHKSLNLTPDMRIDVSEVEFPTLSGRKKKKLINPLKESEILEIEKCMLNEKTKLQLLLSYYGGLRIGEMLKIKIMSFDWAEWKKDVSKVGECKVYGKGGKEGIAFFPPEIMKRVAAFIRSGKYSALSSHLFVNNRFQNDSKIPCRFAWARVLKDAASKAGITKFDEHEKVIKETHVNPHRLRHSWGYHLHTVKKMDIRNIQEILRHSSINSTQIYTHVEKTELKEMLSKDVFAK